MQAPLEPLPARRRTARGTYRPSEHVFAALQTVFGVCLVIGGLLAARAGEGVCGLRGDGTAAPDGGRGAVTALSAPAPATAGGGDVLSGMIAALLARGLDPFAAACAAVLAHARAGKLGMGTTLTALPAPASAFCTDETSVLRVAMVTGGDALESVSQEVMLNGANAALLTSDGGFLVTQNGGIDFTQVRLYDDPPPYRPVTGGIQRIAPDGSVTYLLDASTDRMPW